jgi:hypothetical protein
MSALVMQEWASDRSKCAAESNVRKTVRSNGECWVATWSFRFANLKHGPSACGAVDLVTTVTLF